MKFKYILFTVLVQSGFVTTYLNAQEVRLREIYNKEVISPTLIRDGQQMQFREVRLLLRDHPVSSQDYLLYRKKSTWGQICLIPAGVMIAYSISNRNRAGKHSIVTAVAGIGLSFTATILRNQSSRHLGQSLWLYNREVLIENYK